MATAIPPSTTLKTLKLAPNQKKNWCQGFPCRAPAGMYSMWRFSTYRRACPWRAAAVVIACSFLFYWRSRDAAWGCGAGLAAGDQVGGALGDGEDRGVQGGVHDDRHHRRVGDPQPADAVDPQFRVDDRAVARARADRAGAGRVVVAADRPPDPVPQAVAVADAGAGPGLGHAEPGEGGAAAAVRTMARPAASRSRSAGSRRKPGSISGGAAGLGGRQPDRAAAVRGGHAGHQGEPAGRGRVAGRRDGQQDGKQLHVRPGACQRAGQRRVDLAVVVPAGGQRHAPRRSTPWRPGGPGGSPRPRAGRRPARCRGRAGGRRGRCRTASAAAASRPRPRTRSPPPTRCACCSAAVVAEVRDAGAPAVADEQAGDQAAVKDGEVRPAQRGPQVGAVGADPPSAGDGQVGPGHSLLRASR